MSKQIGKHRVNCPCEICRELRASGNLYYSIRDFYDARRNGRFSIFGFAMGAYTAFFQWLLQCLAFRKLWNNLNSVPFKKVYQLPHITDGYALVLIGWLMWGWWIFVSIVMTIAILLLIVFGFTIIGKYILFSLPYPLIAIYSIILEFPASVLNRDLGKLNPDKHNPQAEWGKVTVQDNDSPTPQPATPKHNWHIGWLIWIAIVATVCTLVGVFTEPLYAIMPFVVSVVITVGFNSES